MTLKIGRKTSLLLRNVLYLSCFIIGVFGSMVLGDRFGALAGTAEEARNFFWFRVIGILVWSVSTTVVLSLICWWGRTVSSVSAAQNRLAEWNLYLRLFRRSFICFASMLLGFVVVAVPSSSPGPGICISLAWLYLCLHLD